MTRREILESVGKAVNFKPAFNFHVWNLDTISNEDYCNVYEAQLRHYLWGQLDWRRKLPFWDKRKLFDKVLRSLNVMLTTGELIEELGGVVKCNL
jgi:hypothetical protein